MKTLLILTGFLYASTSTDGSKRSADISIDTQQDIKRHCRFQSPEKSTILSNKETFDSQSGGLVSHTAIIQNDSSIKIENTTNEEQYSVALPHFNKLDIQKHKAEKLKSFGSFFFTIFFNEISKTEMKTVSAKDIAEMIVNNILYSVNSLKIITDKSKTLTSEYQNLVSHYKKLYLQSFSRNINIQDNSNFIRCKVYNFKKKIGTCSTATLMNFCYHIILEIPNKYSQNILFFVLNYIHSVECTFEEKISMLLKVVIIIKHYFVDQTQNLTEFDKLITLISRINGKDFKILLQQSNKACMQGILTENNFKPPEEWILKFKGYVISQIVQEYSLEKVYITPDDRQMLFNDEQITNIKSSANSLILLNFLHNVDKKGEIIKRLFREFYSREIKDKPSPECEQVFDMLDENTVYCDEFIKKVKELLLTSISFNRRKKCLYAFIFLFSHRHLFTELSVQADNFSLDNIFMENMLIFDACVNMYEIIYDQLDE